MSLTNFWFWNFCSHCLLVEIDSVTKHLLRELFVKVSICSFRVLGSRIIWYMLSTGWLSQQDIVIVNKVYVLFIFAALVIIVSIVVWRSLLFLQTKTFIIFREWTCVVWEFVNQFLKVEVIVHILGWAAVFGYERVITVLQMCTNSNFISFVVLIYKGLISAHWGKIYLLLFV